LIFGVCELLVWLLNSDVSLTVILLSFKHLFFFLGFASAFFISRKTLILAPLLFVSYDNWEKFFRYLDVPIQTVLFLLCIVAIGTTFVRSEYLVSKTLFASKPQTRSGIGKRFFNFSWRSKQTGMKWILEMTIWKATKIYVFIFAIFLLARLLPDFFPKGFASAIPFIFFGGLLSSTNPAGLLVSNIRTSRTLPLTTNQLTAWLVGLTFGTGVFICLLLVPLFPFMKLPYSMLLIELSILEAILLVQTIAIFIAAAGLRGTGAIVSTVMIIVMVIAIVFWLKLFSEIRIALSILVSLPLAFLIQRECLRKSSALYRPTKESALEV
jgi:hypothetical protein